jgi:hypothetical protein
MAGAAQAQSGTSDGGVTQLPVGQIYKDFEFPHYEDGQLKFTLSATEAKGITVNRAETTDVKIDLYDNGKVTTTITSPKADLYVADKKMRTNNTVRIERADLEATAQICDFDLVAKQYMLRTNVKVILKNFDASAGTGEKKAGAPEAPTAAAMPAGAVPIAPAASNPGNDSLMDSPGSASTNAAPQ